MLIALLPFCTVQDHLPNGLSQQRHAQDFGSSNIWGAPKKALSAHC